MDVSAFDHDAWRAAAGTGVGYLLLLVALFVVVFVVPTLVFEAVGVV